MAKDIYGRESLAFGGAFAADSAAITFAGAGTCLGQQSNLASGAGLLAQNLSFTYQQPIQRFFDLGTNFVYYFAGRPQGQGGLSRLLGPRLVAETFYTVLGNVCCGLGNNITITAATGCNGGGNPGEQGSIAWTLEGVVLNTVAANIAAEDMIFREQLGFIFFALKMKSGATINSTSNGFSSSGSNGFGGGSGGGPSNVDCSGGLADCQALCGNPNNPFLSQAEKDAIFICQNNCSEECT